MSQGRRRVGQGASSIVWYQPPRGQDTTGIITKQSKSRKQDQNIRNQQHIYQYLMTLPQFNRHIPTIVGKGQTPMGRRYLSMSSEDPSVTRDLISWVNHNLTSQTARRHPEILIQMGNDLLDAIYFMHRHNVVHGDVKPDNIIVDSHNHLKVIDFAYSRIMESPGTQRRRVKIRGTRTYMPPEFFRGTTFVTFRDIMGYDFWATGIVLLILVWVYYSNQSRDTGLARLVLHILQPVLNNQGMRVLTHQEKTFVDGIFHNLFPRYEMNLFATNPSERFIRLRPPSQQRKQQQQRKSG